MSIYQSIKDKNTSIAIIGLGYVGLPIALEFAKKSKVIGFDINVARLDMMRQSIDPSGELDSKDFEGCDIVFTDDLEVLKEATFFVVAVPTPINAHNTPNLTPLLKASESVGKVLKKGDYVVYESTVYPGCTEEDCVPVLEKHSGLKFVDDFKVGYSPERINPGDKVHTLSSIIKVVSGCDQESCDEVSKVYELVVDAGVHKASSIKVAEAAKIIENTQRDVNIALMNELSIIFDKLGINTYEVLEAAGTKWNFLKFVPGLVGGHCIGVDPYYLTYKSQELGYIPKVILSGRAINDGMGAHIAKRMVQMRLQNGKNIATTRALVMGVTFKENVEDIRNSKVVDLIKELLAYSIEVDAIDPKANIEEFKQEYDLQLSEKSSGKYEYIIVAVNHKEYLSISEEDFLELAAPDAVIIDIKGVYRDVKFKSLDYWSL